ncbi:MAG: bifunctional UDP-N-acetylglucosamine diphosphorylase/glucosamine-1-phosphate N-acetyltransferase GlmU [Oligoflexia bacterium]|nr:bifunctional UDP-N-acetylglucosamine diphosphorylase/glucosamine-1-phosphate N-acetyltransferase GlmU [Oligoflexia bacterium]
MDLNVIILAAGRGQRMSSQLPKVLHPVAGQPMLVRILKAVSGIYPKQVRVVVGPVGTIVSTVASKFKALCFQQKETAWGTAQAVLTARPEEMTGDILIINSDHPLIQSYDLTQFIRNYHKMSADCAVASFKNSHPNEYGRLLFEGEQLVDIVEAYEVDKRKTKNDFVNAGVYIIKADLVKKHLKEVKKNVKEEYNLTDLISILNKKNYKVRAIDVPWHVAFGVNNQKELSIASSIAFENNSYKHLDNGVVIMDLKATYIEDEVVIGKGSLLYPGVYLRGNTKIGAFCAIESNAYIFDSLIKNYVNIKAGSYIEGSVIGEKSVIGPYAHLRPETVIGEECRIGNFVETKKITMNNRSKASHLTYLGDVEIGSQVNIGCSTVTCNYGTDKKKQKTKIGDKAFIGSGVQLVAPVEIGESAIVGAGSVITKNVPKQNLAIERNDQKNIKNYKPKNKDE